MRVAVIAGETKISVSGMIGQAQRAGRLRFRAPWDATGGR